MSDFDTNDFNELNSMGDDSFDALSDAQADAPADPLADPLSDPLAEQPVVDEPAFPESQHPASEGGLGASHSDPAMTAAVSVGALGAAADGAVGTATETVEWYETNSGTYVAYTQDGSVLEMGADGTVVLWAADGTVHQQDPDGTVHHWSASAEYLGYDFDEFYFTEDASDTGIDGDTDSETDVVPELEDDTSYDQYDQADPEDTFLDSETYETDPYNTELVEEGVFGNAYEWHGDWFFQEGYDYCGPTSVAILVNEFFEAGITDPEMMVEQARSMGLYSDDQYGMMVPDILTLLQSQGVPSEMVYSDMNDLAARLQDGYGIMVAVDSGELWGDPNDEMYEDWMADHALIVTQIDTTTGMVTLADPGSPDGNGIQYPIEQFADAWADSGNVMISTTESDPDLVDTGAAGGAGVGAATDDTVGKKLGFIPLTGKDGII